jgi:YhcG PDDEXK nuclease domain
MSSDAHERELESGLLAHLQSFLLELGIGFSFVGSQYPIEVDGVDYKLDLLFYHFRLRAFVIIELKAGALKPEYTGKMNFYLSAVDALLKHASDQPSIGLILCKSKKKLTVEYALRNTATPMGVAESDTSKLSRIVLKEISRPSKISKQSSVRNRKSVSDDPE